jgi:glycosyltransferase involved in cell wall biosynthesis
MVDPKYPKITVLMPVYNCELYINEAIDSILNQTFIDFEFLVIDDASTDATAAIIKNYNDPRIQLIQKPINSGYTNSLNYGLKVAKGEYIARMDGDDISLPKRFEKQVAFLDANPDVVLCGTALKVIGSNRVIRYSERHESIKLNLLKENCIIHPSVMLRKCILEKYSLIYDIAKEPAEDYDLWVRLSSVSKLYNLQEVLLDYRMHESQVSRMRNKQQVIISIETKLNLLNQLNFETDLIKQNLLRKILSENKVLHFDEIELFQKIKIELLKSNVSRYFEPLGFELYLVEIENRIIKNFFLKRNHYTPIIFFQYLKIRCKLKFTYKQKFKLFVKSILFWNAKVI